MQIMQCTLDYQLCNLLNLEAGGLICHANLGAVLSTSIIMLYAQKKCQRCIHALNCKNTNTTWQSAINSVLTDIAESITNKLKQMQMHKNNLVQNNLHTCISSADYLLLLHGVWQMMKFQQHKSLSKMHARSADHSVLCSLQNTFLKKTHSIKIAWSTVWACGTTAGNLCSLCKVSAIILNDYQD